MSKSVGRPTKATDVRDSLLANARSLFAKHGYAKVTTRTIAEAADSDPAMIRYYFGSKERLFKAVLTETVQPLLDKIRAESSTRKSLSPAQFIEMYYSLLAEEPDLPRLIFRSIHDKDAAEHGIVNAVFRELLAYKATQLRENIKNSPEIDKRFDPVHVLISTLSLAVFPFLIPDDLKQELNITIDRPFLSDLAQHQDLLLSNGIANRKDSLKKK